jgi:excisionase family DNA binding protein
MIKLRTLKECYEYIKTNDRETAITPYFLRQMVIQGKIPYLKAGCKYLISLETLEKFISGELCGFNVSNCEKTSNDEDNE